MATRRGKSTRKATKRTTGKTARKSTGSTRRKTRRKTTKNTTASAKKAAPVIQKAPWEVAAAIGGTEDIRILDVPWEMSSIVRQAGGTKVDQVGWAVTASKCSGILDLYRAKEYSWGRYVEDRANGVEFSPKATSDTGQFTLRDDQVEDAATVVKALKSLAPEAIICNGTGTGKTITTTAAVNQLDVDTVVVFCPKSVIPAWRRTVSMMGDSGKQWVIINYESSKRLIKAPAAALKARKAATRNKHIALHGTPWFGDENTLVVCDESHKVKNPTSQQSRVVDKFFDAGAQGIRLSATPGGPAELHYLRRGLAWATGDTEFTVAEGDFSDYVSWCKNNGIGGIVPARFGNGITFEGSSQDAERMHSVLFSPSTQGITWGIRRVMDTWPEQERIALPMEFTPDQWELYNLEWTTFQNTMLDVNRVVHSASSGKQDVQKARMTGLAAQTRYRQKVGSLKAEAAADLVKEYLAEGNQVVVSCIYHDTVDRLSELLDAKGIDHVALTGKNTGDQRENDRIRFQTGEVKVIINSVTTGISLHAGEDAVGGNDVPRRQIVAECHYSHIAAKQNEGRSQRSGTAAPVTYLFAEGTVDEKVVQTVLKKMHLQSEILGDSGDAELLAELGREFGFELIS